MSDWEPRLHDERDDAPPDADAVVPVPMQERSRRRSPVRAAISVVGVVALVAVGAVAVTSIGNHGGAQSPDAAVRALASAIDAGDPLAAVDVVAPDEVRSLRSTIGHAERKAEAVKVVEHASKPFAGIDFAVDDLALSDEELADGYVKVHLKAGTLTATVHGKQLAPLVQELASDDDDAHDGVHDATGTVDVAKVRREDEADPYVVVIRRDGRWYVSAAYTALEYARAGNDLAAADYGSGLANEEHLGAASPEAAVTDMVRALGGRHWNDVFALLPPRELPLYDYRHGLADALGDGDGFEVDTAHATAVTHGADATVDLTASGTYQADGDTVHWKIDKNCLSFDEPMPDSSTPVQFGFGDCAGSGTDDAMLGFPDLGSVTNPGSLHIHVVESHGRWFVSPVSTVLDAVDQIVSHIDTRTIDLLTGNYGDLPADGSVTLDHAVRVPKGAVRVYTFQGRADQRVVATDGDESNTNRFEFFAFLYGPDRQPVDDGYSLFSGQPITLPSDGTYKLVIFPTTTDGSVTLWDVRHAPAGAVHPDDFGMPDDIRSCLQAGSETTATTATTGAALCLRTLPAPGATEQDFGPAPLAP